MTPESCVIHFRPALLATGRFGPQGFEQLDLGGVNTRDLPGMNPGEWLRLAFWTMLGGSLAAGSANAINQ